MYLACLIKTKAMQTPHIRGILPAHLQFIAPKTRIQRLAYFIILGHPPCHAARMAGYAINTCNTGATRLVSGKKVQRLIDAYSQRLGVLSNQTHQQAIEALLQPIHGKSGREALNAIRTLTRLTAEHLNNPNRNLF